jgi:hypothetical protein
MFIAYELTGTIIQNLIAAVGQAEILNDTGSTL